MLAKQIELAPKNGDFVVLQDGWSGSWEVGRWAPESGSWIRIDGKPLRIFPTHWSGSEDTEGLSFLAPAIQVTEFPKRPRNRFILAFTVAAIFIGGFVAFDLGFTGAGPASLDKTDLSVAELKREVSGERDGADVTVHSFAPARKEIAFPIAREDAGQAGALEAKLIADAKQKELMRALDESEARAEALARELASFRSSTVKPSNENVVDGVSSTGKLNRPTQETNATSGITGVGPSIQSLNEPTAGTPTFSSSAVISAAPENPVVEPLRPAALPRLTQPTSAISPADEARLIARAVSLIKRYDFSGARLFLEHALQNGSAPAAFMMAETYDWRMLRAIRAYRVRWDTEKAREFYALDV